MEKKKVKTLRETKERPALFKRFQSRIKQEYLDYDYLNSLSIEELEWLNTFSEEWINARMNHGKENLHKDKQEQRQCYTLNNQRNRCLYGKARANFALDSIEEINEEEFVDYHFEDRMIEKIDDAEEDTTLD